MRKTIMLLGLLALGVSCVQPEDIQAVQGEQAELSANNKNKKDECPKSDPREELLQGLSADAQFIYETLESLKEEYKVKKDAFCEPNYGLNKMMKEEMDQLCGVESSEGMADEVHSKYQDELDDDQNRMKNCVENAGDEFQTIINEELEILEACLPEQMIEKPGQRIGQLSSIQEIEFKLTSSDCLNLLGHSDLENPSTSEPSYVVVENSQEKDCHGEGGKRPPKEALDACNEKRAGDDCSFSSPRGSESGTCFTPDSAKPLACRPS